MSCQSSTKSISQALDLWNNVDKNGHEIQFASAAILSFYTINQNKHSAFQCVCVCFFVCTHLLIGNTERASLYALYQSECNVGPLFTLRVVQLQCNDVYVTILIAPWSALHCTCHALCICRRCIFFGISHIGEWGFSTAVWRELWFKSK